MAAGNPPARSTRRWLLGAASVGLVLRLAFGLLYWTNQPLTRDELEYLSLARSLASGHGFVYDAVLQGASFGRAPGYPAFLALVGGGREVVSAVPARVKIAQAFVGALGVILVGLVARRLAGDRAGRIAAWLAAVYPPLTWIAAYAWSEAVFWPLGVLTAWLFDRADARPASGPAAITCGLVAGAGILTRPNLLLFVPLAALYWSWRRHGRAIAGFVLGLALVIGPWTVRNHIHYGRWMIVASDGGVTFWTGNHPLATGEGDMAANPQIKRDNLRLRAAHPGLSEEQMEPIYYREAFGWIRRHPAAWLWLECRKAFYTVVPIGPSYTLHSARYVAASLVSYLGMLALALAGAIRVRDRFFATPGLWLLAGSAVLTCLVFFPQERFRIPVIDPALVVLGGAGLATLLPRRRPRS
jgi:4-amino-4-deoxy-L-arabinose transferase-like glycosyltransferase